MNNRPHPRPQQHQERAQQAEAEYVVGFLFRADLEEVVLIRKNRPAWQAGKINGIGGRVELEETPPAAMTREFHEEAGVLIQSWFHFRTEYFIHGTQAQVHYFAALASEKEWAALSTQTDEVLYILQLKNLPLITESLIYTLSYLIPMATVLLRQPIENIPAP